MIKRCSPRQQRTAKGHDSQPSTSGSKRNRVVEEKSSKKRKGCDYSVGRKKNCIVEDKGPNRQKDSDDAWDNYCWKCHKFGVDEKCTNCIRVYCSKCFKNHKNQVCEPCLQQMKSEEAFSAITDTSSLLLSVIETSFSENEIKNRRLINWQPKQGEVKLSHIVDYTYIDSKSKDTDGLQYRSPTELLDDVKWMYHNCVIVHGEDQAITKEAKKILNKFVKEIADLSDCAECYRKAFLNICDPPHPLIMAKQRSYPPWPAKCLRVLDSKAHVRYFGSHEMAYVPLKDCQFVYKDCFPKKAKRYETAEKEFSSYIELFENTIGEYPYQPKDTPFNEEVGKNLIKAVKEKYQRVQKARIRGFRYNTSNMNCSVIDLTMEEDCRDSKINVDMITEENERLQSQRNENLETSSNFLEEECIPSSNNFSASGTQNDILPASSMSCNNIQPGNTWAIPLFGSTNESSISISNVYSGSDSSALPAIDLNAQDTPFIMNDSPAIQTAHSFGMPLPNTAAAAENNNSEENDDDDVQVVFPDTQNRLGKVRNLDDKIVQTILNRDPSSYAILKMTNQLVRHLFIQFWGITNGLKNAPEVLAILENKIKRLKKERAQLLTQQNRIKEKFEDRVGNADTILRSIKSSYALKCDNLQQKNQELEDKINNLSKELAHYKSNQESFQDTINDYKLNSFCSKCKELANFLCCTNGVQGNVYYCSKKCQEEHKKSHSNFCTKYQNQPQILCQATKETVTFIAKPLDGKSPTISPQQFEAQKK